MKVIRIRESAISLTISILANIVLFSAIFLIPVFVELVKGSSALTAGLILLPQGITTGIGTVIGEYWSRKGDKRLIVIVGMAILTVTTIQLAFISASSSSALLAAILCGRGIALGLTIQPLLYKIIGSLPSKDIPDANTLFNVAERISGAFGISILASIFELREEYYLTGSGISSITRAGTMAFHDMVVILIIISAIGLIMAFSLGRTRFH